MGSNKRRRAVHKANKALGTPRAVKVKGPEHVKPTGRKRSYQNFFQNLNDVLLSRRKVETVELPPPHSPGHEDD